MNTKLLKKFAVAVMAAGLLAGAAVAQTVDITDVAASSIATQITAEFTKGENSVTVTGTNNVGGSGITLTIPTGKTVVWQATLTSSYSAAGALVLQGGGTLEVATGGSIANTGGRVIDATNGNVVVNGGSITGGTAIVIRVLSDGTAGLNLTVNSGTISNSGGTATMISWLSPNGTININGGTIQHNGTSGTAVRVSSTGTLNLSGNATISSSGAAVDCNAAGGTINIGATVPTLTGTQNFYPVSSTTAGAPQPNTTYKWNTTAPAGWKYEGVYGGGGGGTPFGTNLTWEITGTAPNQTLTIAVAGGGATGSMPDWDMDPSPWYEEGSKVSTINIADGVTNIGSYAFDYFHLVTTITIPESVTSIGEKAFRDCDNLTSIEFKGATPPTFGNLVFAREGGVANVDVAVPSGAKAAYNTALVPLGFSIEKITEAGGPEKIGTSNTYWQFESGTGVLTISGTGAMPAYTTSNYTNRPWQSHVDDITTVIIEEGVEGIGLANFRNQTALTSVTIAASVTSIGNTAFREDTRLTSIEFKGATPPMMSSSNVFAYVAVANISVTVPAGAKAAYVASDLVTTHGFNPDNITEAGGGGDADNAAIAAAKSAIEGATYGPIAMTSANSAADAKAAVQTVIDALELDGVIAVIVDGEFSEAVAGTAGNVSGTNGSYAFTVTLNRGAGTQQVTESITLVIVATGYTSILSPDRNIPQSTPNHDAAVIAPVSVSAFELSAGPNPVRKTDGVVNIFISGKRVDDGTLTVFDVTGNVINKITVRDNAVIGNNGKRVVGSWDLRDGKGNHVSASSYLLRGSVKTVDGKRERVSVVVGVR